MPEEKLERGHAAFTSYTHPVVIRVNEDDTHDDILQAIKGAVNDTIDAVFERYSEDRAFYDFRLSCIELNGSFEKRRETVLIDDRDTFCEFCGAPTGYRDRERDVYMCAKCFGDMNGG